MRAAYEDGCPGAAGKVESKASSESLSLRCCAAQLGEQPLSEVIGRNHLRPPIRLQPPIRLRA